MQELLPILQTVFTTASGCECVGTVIQANAEGHRVMLQEDQPSSNANQPIANVFVKRVDASKYSGKKWPDFRRTLMYLRTEVRFYQEVFPDLYQRGFQAAPKVFGAHCDLSGLIEDDEEATDQFVPEPARWSADEKGGFIIMESIGEPYFQDSPISAVQAKQTLSALAGLHAAAWEDTELLEKVERRLSRGSYHLKTRNVKELEGIEEAWENFSSHFRLLDVALFDRVGHMGTRIKALAEYISDEVSPVHSDPFATISHGDFKSMNCFLPSEDEGRGVVLVDFASTGVGLGMSDVAMHIHHAVLPEELSNGGEDELLDHYLESLNHLLGSKKHYPRNAAMRHYRLAVADYFRFFLGRFWKSATLKAFEKKKDSKNTALINRNKDSALAFLDRVDRYLSELEREKNCKA